MEERRRFFGRATQKNRISMLKTIYSASTEAEDEAFFILEGNYEFRLGDKTIELGPRSLLFAPRGIPHSCRNEGTTMSGMLVIVSPAGLENFFIEMGQPVTGTSAPATSGRPPDIEKLVAITQKYGVELLTPS